MVDLVSLSYQEMRRYSRHLLLPEVGLAGQHKLKAAKVLCVGVGGLGSLLALYLAAAGVGKIGLIDNDVVDITNLHRQILHHTHDVGRSKIESAQEKLRALNPDIDIQTYDMFLSAENALEIFAQYDYIADGSDNFPTRYLVNDACVLSGKPNIHASIFKFEGQASVFCTPNGPCYRCLYPVPPEPGTVPNCAEAGVLGILPGLLGVIQATEVIKLILGLGQPLIGRLLMFDALEMATQELHLKKDPACPLCSPTRTIDSLTDYQNFCGVVENRLDNAVAALNELDATELARRLDADNSRIKLIDVRSPHEWQICRINGALHIPLDLLAQQLDEADQLEQLDKEDEIVVYCLSGKRSQSAIQLLHQAGYTKVSNLSGGIRAWAQQMDSSMPIY